MQNKWINEGFLPAKKWLCMAGFGNIVFDLLIVVNYERSEEKLIDVEANCIDTAQQFYEWLTRPYIQQHYSCNPCVSTIIFTKAVSSLT